MHNILDFSAVKEISGSDAEIVINKIRPSFVFAGWGSTVLCESLNMGIIPIAMSATRTLKEDIVYKVDKRSLLWPSEMNIVRSILKNNRPYKGIIDALRKGSKLSIYS